MSAPNATHEQNACPARLDVVDVRLKPPGVCCANTRSCAGPMRHNCSAVCKCGEQQQQATDDEQAHCSILPYRESCLVSVRMRWACPKPSITISVGVNGSATS